MPNVKKYKCLCTKQIIIFSLFVIPSLVFFLSVRTISFFLPFSLFDSLPNMYGRKHSGRSYIFATNYINIITNRRNWNLRSMSLFVNRSKNKDALNSPFDHAKSADKVLAIPCISSFYPILISSSLFLLFSSLLHYRLFLIEESRLLFACRDSRVDDEVTIWCRTRVYMCMFHTWNSMISRSLVPSMSCAEPENPDAWENKSTNWQTADRRRDDAKLRFRSYIASRHEEHIAIPLACEPLESSGSHGPGKEQKHYLAMSRSTALCKNNFFYVNIFIFFFSSC